MTKTRTIVLRTILASVIAIGAGCACASAASASAVPSSSGRPGPAGPPVPAVQAPRDPGSKGSLPLSAATSIALRNCSSAGPTAADAALASQLSPRISTDRMNGIDAGQVSCARVISQVVSDDGLASRAAVIAITTAITESTLHDYTQAVDHDSLGLYQQRPSQGWGTAAQVIDPTYATNKFLDVMQSDYPGGAWTTGDIGAICQSIQRSAFPAEYDKQVAAAQLIVNSLGTAPPAPAPSTPGLARFSGSAWTFYMYNYTSGPGVTDEYVTWPGTLASDKPLVGDWTGSGRSTPGLARFSGGAWTFYMYNYTSGTGVTDEYVKWTGTMAGDVPLVGDWTGSGKTTPGLARFGGSAWTTYMYNHTSGAGVTDEYVTWPGTLGGDKPLVGNWIR